jgi:hypothetical protein
MSVYLASSQTWHREAWSLDLDPKTPVHFQDFISFRLSIDKKKIILTHEYIQIYKFVHMKPSVWTPVY